VALARRALGTRRIGHAGTLDPMATGLLVLAVGEGLKILRYLALDDKRYDAVIRLGSETDTLDADGRVTRSVAVPAGLTLSKVSEAAQRFEGMIVQRPPLISALKRDGVPLYKRARRGEQVEAADREVLVHAIEVGALSEAQIELRVHCGKGFYVRALARDLAGAIGTVGHLVALRRLQSGHFELKDSVGFELMRSAAGGDSETGRMLVSALLPIERALVGVPRLVLDAQGVEHARQGRAIALEHVVEGDRPNGEEDVEPVLLCSSAGELLALARCAQGVLRVVRGFRC
jgi:tRNA pseudouridine55 synthase